MGNIKLKLINNIAKGLVIVFNSILLLFCLFLIYAVVFEKEVMADKFFIFIPPFLILAFSVVGFFFRNNFGWFFTVLPVFLVIQGFIFFIWPYGQTEPGSMFFLLLIFNFFLVFFNSKSYQNHFDLKLKGLVVMNLMAAFLSFFLAWGYFLFFGFSI